MKGLYRVTIKRTISSFGVVEGMWVEILSTIRPTQKAVADAFIEKYGLNPRTPPTTFQVDIVKIG